MPVAATTPRERGWTSSVVTAEREPGGAHDALDAVLFAPDINLVADVSHGTNRLAPPRHILDELGRQTDDWAALTEYSGPVGNLRLREVVATYEGATSQIEVAADNVVITNGAAEALRLVFEYLRHRLARRVLAVAPQFGVVHAAALRSGMELVECIGPAHEGFLPPVERVVSDVVRLGVDVVVLTSPSNPAGTAYSSEELAWLGRALARRGDVTFVVDKVGADVPSEWTPGNRHLESLAADLDDNRLVLVDGLSKRRSLPALRVGYVVAGRSFVSWAAAVQYGGTPSRVALRAVECDFRWSAAMCGRGRPDDPVDGDDESAFRSYVLGCQRTIADNRARLPELLGDVLEDVTRLDGGQNCLVRLPRPGAATDVDLAVALARSERVGTYPLDCFLASWPAVAGTGGWWVRVTVADEPDRFATGVARLGAAYRSLRSRGRLRTAT